MQMTARQMHHGQTRVGNSGRQKGMALNTVLGKSLPKGDLIHEPGRFKTSPAQSAYISFESNWSVQNVVHDQAKFLQPHFVSDHAMLIWRCSGPNGCQS